VFDEQKFIKWNQEWNRITGYDDEEIKSMYGTDFFAGKDKDVIAARMKKVFTDGYADAEAYISSKDGKRIPYYFTGLRKNLGGKNYLIGLGMDITERKIAEDELKDSEERFRNITEQVSEVIFLTDDKGLIKYISPASKSVFGCEPQEMEGNLFMKFLKKTEIPKAMKKFMSTFLSGTPTVNMELVMNQKNGNTFIGELTARKYTSARLKGTVGVIRDITMRKQSEAKIREQEGVLNKFFEQPLNLHLIAGVDGTIKRINKGFKRILGYNTKELIGKNFLELVHPDDKEATISEMNQLSEGKVTFYFENRYIHKRGDFRTLAWSALVSKEDKIIYAVANDITDRKKAEEALKESETRFKALHNASFGGIAIHDKSIILECNKGLSEISGYDIEELIGMNGLELISEKTRNMVMDKIQSGYEKPYEAIGQRKNGEKYPLRLEAREIPYKGEDVRVVEFRDITEQKRSEEELLRLNQFRNSVIEDANMWLNVLDKDSNVVIWNKAAEEISGYKRNEVLGKSEIWEWFYPEKKYRDMITTQAAEIIKKNKVLEDFETNICCKDGSFRTISWNSRSLVDQEGNSIGSIALGRDVTERKQALEELAIQRNFLEKAQQIGQIGTWEYTITTDNTYWTEEMYKIFGIPVGTEISSKLFFDLIHPEDKDKVQKLYKEAFETKMHEAEFRIIINDKVKWVREKANYVDNEMGIIEKVIGVTQDITKSKQAEKALKESEEKFRNLYDSMSIGCGIWKKQDDKFILKNYNKAGEEMDALDKNEMLGKNIFDLFPDATSKFEISKIFNEVLKTGKSEFLGAASYVVNNESVWRENYIYKLSDDEIVTIFNDITKRKNAEEELKGKMSELEIFNDAAVDRELKIIALKKEINKLIMVEGKEQKYEIPV